MQQCRQQYGMVLVPGKAFPMEAFATNEHRFRVLVSGLLASHLPQQEHWRSCWDSPHPLLRFQCLNGGAYASASCTTKQAAVLCPGAFLVVAGLVGRKGAITGKAAKALRYSLERTKALFSLLSETSMVKKARCRIIPGEVWYKKTGVEDEADCVINQLVIAESLVAALMSNHPDSCAHGPLQTCVCELNNCYIPRWYLSVWLGIFSAYRSSVLVVAE